MNDFQVKEIYDFLMVRDARDVPKPLLQCINDAVTKYLSGRAFDAYLIGKRLRHIENLEDKYVSDIFSEVK